MFYERVTRVAVRVVYTSAIMSLLGDDLPVQVTHIPGITRVRYVQGSQQEWYVPLRG